MSLIEEGLTDTAIARKLGTTANAVNLARKRYRLIPRSKAVLTARAVAKMLGIGCAKTVTRWAKQGWLKARRGWRHGQHRVLMVNEGDLHAFMENSSHWHRWDPARIPEKALREWATEIRHGERFLTLSEVADRFFVQTATVGSWIEKGLLPEVRNGNHLVRESDLTAFQLPKIGGYNRKRESVSA